MSMVTVVDHSRPKSIQKTYHDQFESVILISSKFESLFGIQKGRIFARVTVRSQNTEVNKKIILVIS